MKLAYPIAVTNNFELFLTLSLFSDRLTLPKLRLISLPCYLDPIPLEVAVSGASYCIIQTSPSLRI